MTPPLVSIIIPVYNAQAHLAEALDSAAAQTWKNIEVLVVDDGSTDNSLTIARRFESTWVKIFTQDNRGAAAARNTGLRKASGDYIQYLDADDLLAPSKVEAQMKLLQSLPGEYVASCGWGHFRNSPNETEFEQTPVWTDATPVDWLVSAWEGGGMMADSCWLVPRKVVEKAGPWDESLSLHDDGEYFCRILLKSKGVRFCLGTEVYYRWLNGSVSRHRDRAAAESALTVYESYEAHVLPYEDSLRVRRALAKNYSAFLYEYHPNYPDLAARARQHISHLGLRHPPLCGGKRFRAVAKLIGFDRALIFRSMCAR